MKPSRRGPVVRNPPTYVLPVCVTALLVLSGTALGARPILEDVDYELVAGQSGVTEFETRETLGTQEGSVYFHNVEPGTAAFGVRNSTGQACAYMPAMEEGSSWETEVEAGVHLVLPFQCHNPQ